MSAGAPMRIRGIYRSPSHLPIWSVLREAGIWQQVGLELIEFEYVQASSDAERALLAGDVDFISRNHISTYTQFLHGQPIVYLTSRSNSVHDAVVTRERIVSVAGRQLLLRAIRDVQEDRDPPHVIRDAARNDFRHIVVMSQGIDDSADWRNYWRCSSPHRGGRS